MTEDGMVGWHHQLNEHEFEQTLGDSEGQGSLSCCSPWGHKESDTTERLNINKRRSPHFGFPSSRHLCCFLAGPSENHVTSQVIVKAALCTHR